jgi:hypothetical protein
MICQTVSKVNLKPPHSLSHGICLECMPGYLRQSKMTEEEINDFMKKYKKEDVK